MSQAEPRVDAVFEGGGVKGIALIGAAAVVEAAGSQFYNLAGTSAGAIVAALLGAGYTAAELQPILMDLAFTTLLDPATVLSRIPLVGSYLGILTDLGMYKGDAFLHRMREWLAAKGVKTFGDLILPGETEMRYRFKVHVVASDISRGNLVILPDDAPVYGAARCRGTAASDTSTGIQGFTSRLDRRHQVAHYAASIGSWEDHETGRRHDHGGQRTLEQSHRPAGARAGGVQLWHHPQREL
jgi:predicted acylesterase/phospholipase RssA